jgi:type IV secretory pathway VirJ component
MGAAAKLAALALALAPAAGSAAPGPMPIVEVPARGDTDTVAIFYSGDGGWATFDRSLAASLARQGVPTVGVDSMRYFWTRRSPDAAAADLSATARRYMAAWRKPRVLLVGFSFGADALPLIVPRLAPDLRARLRGVALISPGRSGELQFHLGSWLDHASPDAVPIAPLLAQMRGAPALCIYGDHDAGNACNLFGPRLVRPMQIPGGHHLGGDFDALAQAILRADG